MESPKRQKQGLEGLADFQKANPEPDDLQDYSDDPPLQRTTVLTQNSPTDAMGVVETPSRDRRGAVKFDVAPIAQTQAQPQDDSDDDMPPPMTRMPTNPRRDVNPGRQNPYSGGNEEKWSKEKRILISIAVFCVMLFALVYVVKVRLSTSLLITLAGTFLLGWWTGYMSKERGYNCS